MSLYIENIFSIDPQSTVEGKISVNESNLKFSSKAILNVVEPEYEKLISINSQRRMCKLVKMGVYSALSCIENKDSHNLDAIIVGNGLSVFERTFDFLGSVIAKEEKGLSPTPFIQSLHSTIAGQIALELQFNGYVSTYTQNGFAFENSLTDAFLLASEKKSNVSVLLGALDEAPESYQFIVEKLGMLKNDNNDFECVSKECNEGIRLGEGSVFMKLSTDGKNNSLGCVKGVKTFFAPKHYSMVISGIKELLSDFNLSEKDIDYVFYGNSGDSTQDLLLNKIRSEIFIQHKNIFFKNYCGEYPTATAYAVWMSTVVMNDVNSNAESNSFNDKSQKYSMIINQYQGQYYSVILLSRK